jgi:BMFP domain-containing protein YqiC
VKEAVTRGAPVAILTNGDTRVDDVADLKVRAVAGETLSRILDVVRREETYGY